MATSVTYWTELKTPHQKVGTHYFIQLQCKCGTLKTVRKDIYQSNQSKSCGCLRKELHRKATQKYTEPGDAGLRQYYNQYKYAAKQRNYSFEIDFMTFKNLTLTKCYYCGTSGTTKVVPRGNRSNPDIIQLGTIICNGVDRKDNSLGYTQDNCVPCCPKCNRIKHVLNEQEFYQHLELILANRNSK